VINIVRLEDGFASIAEDLDAIRRRLEDIHEFDEFSRRNPGGGR